MAKEYQTKIQCDFGATMKFMYDNLWNNLGTHYCKTVLNTTGIQIEKFELTEII